MGPGMQPAILSPGSGGYTDGEIPLSASPQLDLLKISCWVKFQPANTAALPSAPPRTYRRSCRGVLLVEDK